MSRWNLIWLLGALAFVVIGFPIALTAPVLTGDSPENNKYKNIKLLVQVLGEVEENYVRPLDDKQMRKVVEDMINGGLSGLDQHSSFIGPEEFKQFEKHSRGRFGGVGIRITDDRASGAIFVETPMVGTPAYKAGVRAGDLILKVDGKSTLNMTTKDAVQLITGKPGSKVTLTVRHLGEKGTEDIEIVRDIIAIDSVLGDLPMPNTAQKWEYMVDKKNGIAYIRIIAFTETTVKELTEVVEKLQEEGMNGLIVDMRDNPGGLLNAAIDVASMFLEPGQAVVSTRDRGKNEKVYRASPPDGFRPIHNVPIVIMLNRYSASASEIVAAALRDHLRAILMGERSFGKGSVQNVIMMENRTSALKLTTASYWRPNGKNIHRFRGSKEEDEWGVKPNKGYDIELSLEERVEYYKYRRKRDVVRKNGEAEAEKKEATKDDKDNKDSKDDKDTKDEKVTKPFKDRVMEKALTYLRKKIRGNAQKQQPQGLILPPPAKKVEPPVAPKGQPQSQRPGVTRQPISGWPVPRLVRRKIVWPS
ncbi:MAG: S41 family peptidase [Gemmataceae bacterium]